MGLGAGIDLIIEGKGLEPALREMERSPDIKVIGPHICGRNPGAGTPGMRIAVRVNADTPAEARELLRRYLPADGNYVIRPALI